jgi:hypothetical protein
MHKKRYGNVNRYSRGRNSFGSHSGSASHSGSSGRSGSTGRSGFGGYSGPRFNKSHRSNPYSASSMQTSMYISKAQKDETDSIYASTMTFSDFPLATILANNVSHKGYVHPTKIQAEIIPQVLENKDVLGIACTGSGKTAAYLIPMINKVLRNPGQK